MPTVAAFLCAAALAAGCSNQGAQTTQDSQSVASTASDSTNPQPNASTEAGSPNASPSDSPEASAAESSPGSASDSCALLASDQVEQVMHLAVQSVDVRDNGCTFHFKGGDHGDIVVTYEAQGGHDELDNERKAGQAAKAIFGGITAAASAPPAAMGMISATPPPDVAKVGDDQYFVTEGPVTQFFAIKGDAYVEVDGGFLPEGVSRWVIFPEIARRVLATR